MKTFMRALRLLFVLAFAALAACDRPQAAPNPALWRIADEDSQVWLFGTVHVLPRGLSWRTERIDAALAVADMLVLETETGAGAEQELQALVARHGALPAGQRLSALLDPHERRRLERVARSLGVAPSALEGERPWLAALQLSLAFANTQGQSADHGVETLLAETAQAQGKRLGALETPERQIRSLAELSPEAERAFLMATLRQIEDNGDALDAMDQAWASGDLDALETITERDLREAGLEVYDALITRRNAEWTGRILDLLAGDEDVFIAMGAAHLVGPESVVERLRARGLEVEGP